MSQSRGEKKRKMVIPCNYKREGCLELARGENQSIKCENSGRAIPAAKVNGEENSLTM